MLTIVYVDATTGKDASMLVTRTGNIRGELGEVHGFYTEQDMFVSVGTLHDAYKGGMIPSEWGKLHLAIPDDESDGYYAGSEVKSITYTRDVYEMLEYLVSTIDLNNQSHSLDGYYNSLADEINDNLSVLHMPTIEKVEVDEDE